MKITIEKMPDIHAWYHDEVITQFYNILLAISLAKNREELKENFLVLDSEISKSGEENHFFYSFGHNRLWVHSMHQKDIRLIFIKLP